MSGRLTELLVESHTIIARAMLKVSPGQCLLAFSGGKDSIALAILLQDYGVRKAVCEESFYFTSMKEDVRRLGRELGLELAIYERFKNDLFREHPEWMFPTPEHSNKVYHLTHRETIRQEAKRLGTDCVFFGRRTEENSVTHTLHKLKDGPWQCHPLAQWRTPDVMAFIRLKKVVLPRLYATAMGADFRFNDWPFLERDNYPDPFETIYHVDPATVRECAVWNEAARAVLNRHEPETKTATAG